MSNEIDAIYENGVFRPLEPVQWEEQQHVRVRLSDADNSSAGNGDETKPSTATDVGENWTDEKNHRRCHLIDKEIDGMLTPEEKDELEQLQKAMLAYRRRVAPLPLDDLRALHQELLEKATKQSDRQ